MPFVPHSPPYASYSAGTARLAPAEFDRTQNALQTTTALAEDTAAAVTRTVNLGTDGAANVLLISAAMTALSTSGKPNGTLILRGVGAPIASTVTLDLGYTNINATLAYSGERFTLLVEGSLTFASGIGVGMLIKSGYGAVIDVKAQGGGSLSDVAFQVEDQQCLELSVHGAGFAGTLLKGDANGDATKRIRTSVVRKVSASSCGQAIYWRAMEAFGQFVHIWDNGSVNGAQFINCADTCISLYENYSPASQAIGLDFDNCNSFQVGAISLGDKAAVLMRIKGGDFGRINQIRTSGYAVPAVITGLLLEDLSSVDIDNLQTFRCGVGLEVRGTVSTGGIRIKQHRSMTADVTPLLVNAGVSGAPLLTIGADYRSTQGSITVGAGLSGGKLAISGWIRDFWLAGASGQRAITVDATSGAMILDVSRLNQQVRTGLTGFTDHPTPANIIGVDAAQLGNTLIHGTDPAAAGVVAGTSWQNASSRTVAVVLAIKLNPGVGTNAGCTWRLGPNPASIPVVGDDLLTGDAVVDLTEHRSLRTFIVPPWWYLKVTASTGLGFTLASSYVYAI